MPSSDFPRDRYESDRFTNAFESAEIRVNSDNEAYALFEYNGEEVEVYFPDVDLTPVPEPLRQTALNACRHIRILDNLVQGDCEKEAGRSEHDVRNFKLSIAYLRVYADRLEVRYWGEVVNTEWEAEFRWDAAAKRWTPINFADPYS